MDFRSGPKTQQNPTGKINLNLSDDVATFLNTVRSYGNYSGILGEGMDVSAKYSRTKQLLDYLPETAIKENDTLTLLSSIATSRAAVAPKPSPTAHTSNGMPRPANAANRMPRAEPLNGRPKMARRDSSTDNLPALRGGVKRMRTTSSSSDLINAGSPSAADSTAVNGVGSPAPPTTPTTEKSVAIGDVVMKEDIREKTPLSQRRDDSGLGLPIQDAVVSEETASPQRREADSTSSPTSVTPTPKSPNGTGIKRTIASNMEESNLGFLEPSVKRFCVENNVEPQLSV